MSVEQALAQFQEHRTRYLDDLKRLARIPSCSFPGFDQAEVHRSAEATAALMRERGFENVELWQVGEANPAVYGERIVDPELPTVLLYNHHDVQPPGDETEWTSAPYEPTERAGRLYARGIADDKGGISVHVSSVAAWLSAAGKLPVNVKLFIEGEEEVGSTHLEAFLNKYRERLAADLLIITDTANLDTGIPSVTTALRGMVAVNIEIRALKTSIHSGLWGGPVPDAAIALSKVLASLVDEQGRILIDGIYEDIPPMTAEARHELDTLPFDEAAFRGQCGLVEGASLVGPESAFEKNWWLPTLSINAMQASSREDARNILVDKAWARVGIRLVPGMDPHRVEKLLHQAIRERTPWGLEIELETEAAAAGWATDVSHPVFAAARDALEKGYGRSAVMMGCGASIPFVQTMSDALGGIPSLLLGIEDPYTNAHGPNESLHLGDWEKATASMIHLFEVLGGVLRERVS